MIQQTTRPVVAAPYIMVVHFLAALIAVYQISWLQNQKLLVGFSELSQEVYMHHRQRNRNRNSESQESTIDAQANLSQAIPGSMVTIKGYGNISYEQRLYLQSYGLLPGRHVQVLTQRPVTIVQVEQTELALEFSISREIFVLIE